MKHEQLCACVAACAIMQPCAALDAAPLPARDLHAACVEYSRDPDSGPGRLCDAYVRGFIAGLNAMRTADSRIVRSEGFSERALRIRLGGRGRRMQQDYHCAQSLTSDVLVGQLLAYVALANEPQAGSASELLAAVVKRFQTCN